MPPIITSRGLIGLLAKMLRSIARSSTQAASHRFRSSADFITIIVVSNSWYRQASQQMRSRPPCSLCENIPMLGQQRKAARRFRQVDQLARQRIDGHAIPGFDRQHRCERAIPETQVDMSRLGGKMVVS